MYGILAIQEQYDVSSAARPSENGEFSFNILLKHISLS